MNTEITQVTQRLATADKMRETTQMLMQPDANWETFLTPAPLSIAIMVELVFISSVTDFSIDKNTPAAGYKYIKHPSSFRACLMQVCNTGWHAFNIAHKNMNQIRVLTGGVPSNIRIVVRQLFTADDKVIKDLLPSSLEKLEDTANACVNLSQEVEQKYSDVILLIQELLEACINAKYFYGEQLESFKNKMEENKVREEVARGQKEIQDKIMKFVAEQVKHSEEIYNKAVASVPSEFEAGVMDFLDGINQGLTFFKNLFKDPKETINHYFGKASKQHSAKKTPIYSIEEIDSKMKTTSHSRTIKSLATHLQDFVKDNGINWDKLYDHKKKTLKTVWIKNLLNETFEKLNNLSHSTVRESALALVEDGIAICGKLDSYKPDQGWNKTQTADLIKRVKKLYNEAVKFEIRCIEIQGSSCLTPQGPMMYKVKISLPGEFAGTVARENAHLLVAQSAEQLKKAKEMYRRTAEDIEENSKEMKKVLDQMQKINIQKINFKTTIEMLGKGMEAMGRVKEQWEKMVQFFQMMATIVKTSLEPAISNFVAGANQTMTMSYNSKLFAKDMFYNQVFQASNIASLVHMISGTYCDVSSKYLMDRVNELSTFMLMDKNSKQFTSERQKVQKACEEAQEGILKLVRTKKAEFESKLDARIAQIKEGIEAVLPPASPEETKKREEIVHAACEEAESDYY